LLRTVGVPTPVGAVADGPNGTVAEAAVRAAAAMGGPVAVKLSSPDVRHKTELGAVLLGVRGDDAVRGAVATLRALPGHAETAVLVEAMADPGVELMVAVRRDGVVPVLVVALGGVWVELLDDAVLIPLPADRATVADRIGTLRAAPLLTGGRGRQAVDLAAVCDLAVAVADLSLAEDLELVELNPVFARPDGVSVVDAVIRRGVRAQA
jgi:succinyl-CoA synthetase beta subunit